MNAEVKKLWIDALRSGEYKQGYDRLKTPEGTFCCLGVLCDLYAKSHAVEWSMGDGRKPQLWMSTAYLPRKVRDWSGLNWNPYVNGESLTSLNDDREHDFNQIADLIEKNL